MSKTPRVNKTKEELVAKIDQDHRIAHMAALTKLLWPALETQDKIYDAQTVLQAIAGYIEMGLKIKQESIKVGELNIDLSKEEDSLIKSAMLNILGLVEIENAYDMAALVRKISDHIGQFGAHEFVKGPMTNIKVTDLVK